MWSRCNISGGITTAVEHLKKPAQYSLVYSKGGSWACSILVLRASSNGLPVSRCGFSVSKKVGNAVVRNRVKRLLREITRLSAIEPGWDMVFIARPACAATDFAVMRDQVLNLLSRARILENKPATD